jgi:PPOX class probable F420-dependent enzyme
VDSYDIGAYTSVSLHRIQEEAAMPQTLSPGFKRLLREPAYCQLATLMPDGSPQNTQVWVETDGQYILVVTAEGRQKVKNVRRDPRVALNVVDPTNAFRIASVRGQVVDVTTEGADRLLDELSKKYLDEDTYPFRQPGEVLLTIKIAPEKTNELGL